MTATVSAVLAALAVALAGWTTQPTCGGAIRAGRARRSIPVGVLVVAGSVVAGPVLAAGVASMYAIVRWWAARRAVARHDAAVAAALPDAVDLLAASLEAGRSVSGALRETSRWAPDPLRGALTTAIERLDAGWRRVDVLEGVVDDLGTEARPLVSALVAADRQGVPIADAVRRLVDDMRRRRRLAAEVAARRLPVRLTIPLVLLVLPAFALVTVVPLLLSALTDLGARQGP